MVLNVCYEALIVNKYLWVPCILQKNYYSCFIQCNKDRVPSIPFNILDDNHIILMFKMYSLSVNVHVRT